MDTAPPSGGGDFGFESRVGLFFLLPFRPCGCVFLCDDDDDETTTSVIRKIHQHYYYCVINRLAAFVK